MLGEQRTLEADSCNADPKSLQARSARTWRERFSVYLRLSCKVERIAAVSRSRSSLSDFGISQYVIF